MKVSVQWLCDYVSLPGSVTELAERLTLAGLEVEAIERPGEALRGVVVGQVKASDRHPNADKLSVTRIDAGGPEPLQVVCGAKNYQVGDKVPLATVGTTLPQGTQIQKSALRGVESFGMLCSARELGLSEDAAGLLILPRDAKPGAPVAEVLGLDDTLLELNITPNRPDALSHLGVARDIAALTGQPLRRPEVKLEEGREPAAAKVKIRIEDSQRCPRYAARVIENVSVGPSPQWLTNRLKACGVRPISNVVDVTNYVLLETGQPLHAFDLEKLAGGEIVVRTARPGERLKTLDDKDRALEADDLVIADRDRAQVIAGVMGGAESEVSPGTQRVLLECASFQPATIRRSARRHGLHTESSHRFERGTDIAQIGWVLERAAALIAELGKGTVASGAVDVYPRAPLPRTVRLRYAFVGQLLGVEVPAAESRAVLERLGFTCQGEESGSATFSVPQSRSDIEREEDLVEEIARIRGYDQIPATLPRGAAGISAEAKAVEVERRIRGALSGAGFDEVVSYSFVAPHELEALGETVRPIALKNPLSVEQSVLRTTLGVGLLQSVATNLRQQSSDLRLYELGRVYLADASGGEGLRPVAQEPARLAGVLSGRREGRTWTAREAPVDFFDAKGAVEAVLSGLGLATRVSFTSLEAPRYHPRAAATVRVEGAPVGTVGELHPRAAKRLDLPPGLFLFELDVDALVAHAQLRPAFQPLRRFPPVLRDLAIVVPVELANAELRRVIVEVGAPLVEDAWIFDVYTGKPIPEGKKNVAYALRYGAADRTLTDAEVAEAHQRIVAEVNARLGGSLRV